MIASVIRIICDYCSKSAEQSTNYFYAPRGNMLTLFIKRLTELGWKITNLDNAFGTVICPECIKNGKGE